jgi:hypothetical protein
VANFRAHHGDEGLGPRMTRENAITGTPLYKSLEALTRAASVDARRAGAESLNVPRWVAASPMSWSG